LIETASPASAPGSRPPATAASARSAAVRAASGLVATNAAAAGGVAATASERSTSSRAEVARATIRLRASVKSSAIAMLESRAFPRADEQPGSVGLHGEGRDIRTWTPLH
jgi:hypothetical protein